MLMHVSPGRQGAPEVVGLFDSTTSSIQYLVADPATGRCAVIDPILDYDPVTGSTSTESADALLDVVRGRGFEIAWILDTHPHADHLTAAHYLKGWTGAPTAIGARVVEMQRFWCDVFGPGSFTCHGAEWDRLFDDGDMFDIGRLACRVISSPGHTLASVTYAVGDALFAIAITSQPSRAPSTPRLIRTSAFEQALRRRQRRVRVESSQPHKKIKGTFPPLRTRRVAGADVSTATIEQGDQRGFCRQRAAKASAWSL